MLAALLHRLGAWSEAAEAEAITAGWYAYTIRKHQAERIRADESEAARRVFEAEQALIVEQRESEAAQELRKRKYKEVRAELAAQAERDRLAEEIEWFQAAVNAEYRREMIRRKMEYDAEMARMMLLFMLEV